MTKSKAKKEEWQRILPVCLEYISRHKLYNSYKMGILYRKRFPEEFRLCPIDLEKKIMHINSVFGGVMRTLTVLGKHTRYNSKRTKHCHYERRPSTIEKIKDMIAEKPYTPEEKALFLSLIHI